MEEGEEGRRRKWRRRRIIVRLSTITKKNRMFDLPKTKTERDAKFRYKHLLSSPIDYSEYQTHHFSILYRLKNF